jgi:hypothetical protein
LSGSIRIAVPQVLFESLRLDIKNADDVSLQFDGGIVEDDGAFQEAARQNLMMREEQGVDVGQGQIAREGVPDVR